MNILTLRSRFMILGGLSLFAMLAHGQDAKKRPALISTELGGKDLEFLETAAESARTQAILAELGAAKAESAPVKTLGASLAKDHAEERKEIEELAAKKGIALVAPPPARRKGLQTKLAELTGDKFDKAWMDEVIQEQTREAGQFEQAIESSDPDIKAFAQKTLPALREHLLIASQLTDVPQMPGPKFRGEAPTTR